VYGVDFDATYDPAEVPGLTINAAVNWNRSHYDAFTNAPCGNGQTISEGCNLLLNSAAGRFTAQDLSGAVLVRAPEWMGVVGADYDLTLSNGTTIALGATATYTSSYSTALVDLPGFYQPSYVKLNANVALRGPDNAWEVALIGNNITDKVIAAGGSNSNTQNGTLLGGQIAGAAAKGPAGSDESSCIAERGRYVAVRMTLPPMRRR
jgi:outer membrane receptor protein involved in Fe transport